MEPSNAEFRNALNTMNQNNMYRQRSGQYGGQDADLCTCANVSSVLIAAVNAWAEISSHAVSYISTIVSVLAGVCKLIKYEHRWIYILIMNYELIFI